MANVICNEEDLTTVADAIREAGDTTESLEFPEEFVYALKNLNTGSDIEEVTELVDSSIDTHNTASNSHSDIRNELSTHTHTEIKAFNTGELLSFGYGDTLPEAGTAGRIFFKKV